MKGKGHRLWKALWKKPLVALVRLASGWRGVLGTPLLSSLPACSALVAATWAAGWRLLFPGLCRKEPHWGAGRTVTGEEGSCGEGITQVSNSSFLFFFLSYK